MSEATLMEQIVSLCKRRGFVYPASEIYGGINGFWDYGPLGVLLKNNIRDWWWRNMVECPPLGPDGDPVEMVGIDTAIIQNPKTWVASGHAGGFSDPMVDDKETKKRYRADKVWIVALRSPSQIRQLIESFTGSVESTENWTQEKENYVVSKIPALLQGSIYVSVEADSKGQAIELAISSLNRHQKKDIEFEEFQTHLSNPEGPYARFLALAADLTHLPSGWVPLSPATQRQTLTEVRAFNLMFESHAGAVQDESSKVYLRPETAQGIFLNFKNITDTTRVRIPFGVAQIGKSFRNEVTPRNFIFRSREFEQMEMEWFCHPDESAKWYEFWKAERMKWWRSLGVSETRLRFRDHAQDELSHYSKMTVDIEYQYPFTAPDFGELEGIAHRGEFDLTQHAKHSGQRLDYFDQERNQRYVPNVIEPASGLTRAVLVLLCEGYTPDASRPSGLYLKFEPRFAPMKLGIFPLVNKDGMPERASKIYLDLRQKYACDYDPKQSIGKRYARMDEIGTPFCVTVDGQTLTDGTVTVRHRDTCQQERVAEDQLKGYLAERLGW